MRRYKDELPAVRVYTVCDESKYLIVRNVPALGCGDELLKLFSTYGDVEECKPMDAEDCEEFTDVYFIKFRLICNARFAKRKLDDSVFLGNVLKVSYAMQFEDLSDTKEKLEARRKEVLARLNPGRVNKSGAHNPASSSRTSNVATSLQSGFESQKLNYGERDHREELYANYNNAPVTRVSSEKDYFASSSMNNTVQFVREKLNKIQSSTEHLQPGASSKRARVDNRRRI